MRYRRYRNGAALAALLLCARALHSAEPSHFEQANRLYEQGKFAESITLYQTMLRAGHNSPGVLFNLGNAHFKNGELGLAIWNYRRAQALSPRDPDIQANLQFARDRVSGGLSLQPGTSDRLRNYFTVNELAAATAVFFWLWLALLSISRYRSVSSTGLRPWRTATAGLFALSFLFLLWAWTAARTGIAIVISRQAIVRLGPVAESQTAFTATDGTELKAEARREGWVQVIDRSGRSGWMRTNDVRIFGPLRN